MLFFSQIWYSATIKSNIWMRPILTALWPNTCKNTKCLKQIQFHFTLKLSGLYKYFYSIHHDQQEYLLTLEIQTSVVSCSNLRLSWACGKSQFHSCCQETLIFASTIFIVVEPEHVEMCRLPSVPVLLEIIVLRLLCGKLLLLLVLFGRKSRMTEQTWEQKHGESISTERRGDPRISILGEEGKHRRETELTEQRNEYCCSCFTC